MSKHTPIPWAWATSSQGMYFYAVGRCGVADIRGGLTNADANFIIRAVNSHDSLLAALDELLEIQDMSMEELDSYPEGMLDQRAEAAWSNARNAIKNAEEK